MPADPVPHPTPAARDHGGGIDAAIARFGGTRGGWIDLSTGINPVAYPLPPLAPDAWTALPDAAAFAALTAAARRFWQVPAGAAILAAPGASALIAQIPGLVPGLATVDIPGPTYNEHAAAFAAHGIGVCVDPVSNRPPPNPAGAAPPNADARAPVTATVAATGAGDATGADDATGARVVVHPNNPTGRLWQASDLPANRLTVIDESFCDVAPDASLMPLATRAGTLILKSFGKFWGLAGLRLGFAIGDPAFVARLAETLGPWQVSGPALQIGAQALSDPYWAETTRARLAADAARLDSLLTSAGATPLGGTTLFRLCRVDDAQQWQTRLARHHIWTRTFPYNPQWLRIGLPAPNHWHRLQTALDGTAGGAMAQPGAAR